MASASSGNFPARLRDLIDAAFGGNVRQAARTIGLSSPSLLALLAGTSSPRGGTLTKISRTFNTSRDWLVDGTGEPPRRPDEIPADWGDLLEWAAYIESLNLPELAHQAVFQLPFAVRRLDAWPHEGQGFVRFPPEALETLRDRAQRSSLHAWLTVLRGNEQEYGRDALRERLTNGYREAAMGFQPIAASLLKTSPEFAQQVDAHLRELPTREEMMDRTRMVRAAFEMDPLARRAPPTPARPAKPRRKSR